MTEAGAATEMTPRLQAHLDALRRTRGDKVAIAEVAEVVNSIMSTISGDVTATDLRLYRELEELSAYIQRAKVEIAELYPDDIRREHLPKAADELDAIVKATEDATGTILEAAEAIDRCAEQAGLADVRDQVIRIFEACSFQDITGQRVKKVVTALGHIEGKIADLARIFGDEVRKKRDEIDLHTAVKAKTDADLLHGPQLPGMGIDQNAVDALFG